jgi:mRNA interferase MazF
VNRGDVWWADLPPPAGRRPVVLLSRDEAYAVRALVVVVPVTTRARGIPAEVPLGPEDGLPRTCVANADTITTIAKSALQGRVARLSSEKLRAVEAAVRFSLGMDA